MDLFVRSNQAFLSLICGENWHLIDDFIPEKLKQITIPDHTKIQQFSWQVSRSNITKGYKYNHGRCTTTTNYKLQGYTREYYHWKLQFFKPTKLKYNLLLILQCKHTTTLEYYNTEILQNVSQKVNSFSHTIACSRGAFTPNKEDDQTFLSIKISKKISICKTLNRHACIYKWFQNKLLPTH